MRINKIGALLGAIVVLVLAAYFLSPYYAVQRLRSAAFSGDVDRIEATVDFPAVRESVKAQLSAHMMSKMQSMPEMKGNPFAGMAIMMIPALTNSVVNTYITADGIAGMVKRGRAEGAKMPASKGPPDITYSYAYRGIDRFSVTATEKKSAKPGVAFALERRGLFSWKMVRVELPEHAFGTDQKIK
jgi:hypothetical protein